MMKSYDEAEVLSNLRHGDPLVQRRAFEQVVRQYSPSLYGQIRRMVLSHADADDVLQNTFIKAWMSIDLFRGESKLSTWLYKIAANESITFLNKQRTQNVVSVDDESVYLSDKLAADEYFDGDELQLRLQQAIATLPPKQRQVFNLRYYDELPYEDISKVMATSVGSLKASYHHAAKKIEDFFKRD